MQKKPKEIIHSLTARSYGLAVGAGNNTEAHAAAFILSSQGISAGFKILTGPDVELAQKKHAAISGSTDLSMEYTAKSMQMRESVSAKIFQLGLFSRAFLELLAHTDTPVLLTPQNMFARQLVAANDLQSALQLRNTPTSIFTLCPDAYGKHTLSSLKTHPLELKSVHLTWNEDGYFFIHEELGIPAELIEPIDPFKALEGLGNSRQEEINQLPQNVLKVSGGSGGDPKLIHTIAKALWENSGQRLMVYSGSKKQTLSWLKQLTKDTVLKLALSKSFFTITAGLSLKIPSYSSNPQKWLSISQCWQV